MWLKSTKEPLPCIFCALQAESYSDISQTAPSREWVPTVSQRSAPHLGLRRWKGARDRLPGLGCSLPTGRVTQTCIFSCTGVLGTVPHHWRQPPRPCPLPGSHPCPPDAPAPEATGEQILSSLSLPSPTQPRGQSPKHLSPCVNHFLLQIPRVLGFLQGPPLADTTLVILL